MRREAGSGKFNVVGVGCGGGVERTMGICRISARLETRDQRPEARDRDGRRGKEGEVEAMWFGFAVCLALAFLSWRGVRR